MGGSAALPVNKSVCVPAAALCIQPGKIACENEAEGETDADVWADE